MHPVDLENCESQFQKCNSLLGSYLVACRGQNRDLRPKAKLAQFEAEWSRLKQLLPPALEGAEELKLVLTQVSEVEQRIRDLQQANQPVNWREHELSERVNAVRNSLQSAACQKIRESKPRG